VKQLPTVSRKVFVQPLGRPAQSVTQKGFIMIRMPLSSLVGRTLIAAAISIAVSIDTSQVIPLNLDFNGSWLPAWSAVGPALGVLADKFMALVGNSSLGLGVNLARVAQVDLSYWHGVFRPSGSWPQA
jgi:hypothetical protein